MYSESDDLVPFLVAVFFIAVLVFLVVGLIVSSKHQPHSFAAPWPYREGCVEIKDGDAAPGVYCIVEIK